MRTIWLDFETRSAVDLRKSNVYRYVECPFFEVLLCAWSDGGPVHVAEGEDEIKQIPGLFDPSTTLIAHNAGFDRIILSTLGPTEIEQWTDTMAMAAEAGLPQGLDALARALGVQPKDSAGTRLINLFSRVGARGWSLPSEKPEQWAQFREYARGDVETLLGVWENLPKMTAREYRVWQVDQRINDRGMRVDVSLARVAVTAAEQNQAEHKAEVTRLTGIQTPGSTQQLLAWFGSSGLDLPNLRADTVTNALSGDLTPEQRRILELRQHLALTASKKFTAALDSVCDDGRVRGAFRYHGAHTGRWAGRGLQPQNLPRATVENVDAAILDLLTGNGADPMTLKGLVRSLFLGPLTVVDYAQIEARVLAWLAGETWAVEAFAEGRDIYVETAERMGGLTRAQGKVAVLALGYGGSVGSLRVMGAAGSTQELKGFVTRWRKSNRRITAFWDRLGTVVENGGQVGKHLVARRIGRDFTLRLPSGRTLVYRNTRWEDYVVKDSTTGEPIYKSGWRYDEPRSKNRIGTYGGRLAENVTQAVARDVLAEALVRLDEQGYPVVAHVHDEILVEGEDLTGVVETMKVPPFWSSGLPIDAVGEVVDRYRKT